MKKNKTAKLLSLLMLLVFMISGCGASSKIVDKEEKVDKKVEEKAGKKVDKTADKTVVIVGEEEVKLNELKLYLRLIEKDFESIGKEDIWETDFDGKTAEELAKERALESLLRAKVVNKKASNLNVALTEDDEKLIEDQIQGITEYLGEEMLKNDGVDEAVIKKMMIENSLANKVFVEATKDFKADLDKIKENIDTDLKDMRESDPKELLKKVRAKHILIKADDTNKEEAKQKAEAILERINAGEDFVSLVKEASEDEASIENDGEYTFARGQMVPEFEAKAFSMKPGEVSGLVETQFGYHIIKLEEILEPTVEEIEQYKQKIVAYEDGLKEQYIQQQKEQAFTTQYEEWKENVNVEIKTEEWEKVHVSKYEKTE